MAKPKVKKNLKVIHIQTTIETIFGVVDEDGDVIKKIPLRLETGKLDNASFSEALTTLVKNKAELEKIQAKEDNADDLPSALVN